MTTSAPQRLVFSAFVALASWTLGATPALASDKTDCAAAQKAAQADQASGSLTKALTELATCSRAVCPKPMQKQCTDLTATVLASQPSVVFSAKDGTGTVVTGVKVTVDGTVVATSLDGTPVPLDPGSHAMTFEMEGAATVEKQVEVASGQKGQTVAVELDANKPAAAVVAPVAVATVSDAPGSLTDVVEDPTKRYYFIGLRYRGDVIPQFMLNLFVNGGKTIYSNSIGAEIDMRHDNFSLIPAITYTEYGTGDIYFSQKGKDVTDTGNWSVINSGLKGIYFSADLLWSTKIAPHWDFEYGAGFGLGVIFGDLQDNWVSKIDANQPNSPTNLVECQKVMGVNTGCNPADHNNSTVNKVGGYTEPSWVNGGSKPNIFPMINFPQLGIRYKPIKQMEARLGVGFSLTGFWFGLSANYGLEKTTK